jgi:hypothetical protein
VCWLIYVDECCIVMFQLYLLTVRNNLRSQDRAVSVGCMMYCPFNGILRALCVPEWTVLEVS